MAEEKTEREEAKDTLERETLKIEVYERLNINADFKVYRKDLLEDPIEKLRDLLETAKDEDLPRIRGQLEALRGVITRFETTINRKKEVHSKLDELK